MGRHTPRRRCIRRREGPLYPHRVVNAGKRLCHSQRRRSHSPSRHEHHDALGTRAFNGIRFAAKPIRRIIRTFGLYSSLPMLADAICCGGWPALVGASPQMAAEVVNQYLDAMYEVSVPQKGGVGSTARHIVSSLARNVATSATLNTIAADASLGDSDAQPATSTVAFYLDMLESMYAIVNLPGWDAPVRAKSRLRTKPKRYFADPPFPQPRLE